MGKHVVGDVLARAKSEIYPVFDSEIIALHVKQSFQRKGVGKALLSRAIEELHERECKSAMLWTLKENQTRCWYKSLNGEVIGKKGIKSMNGISLKLPKVGKPNQIFCRNNPLFLKSLQNY